MKNEKRTVNPNVADEMGALTWAAVQRQPDTGDGTQLWR